MDKLSQIRQTVAAFIAGEKPDQKARKAMRKIVRTQLYRFHNSIELWKTGITNFENTVYPTNEELIRVYNDVVLDAHVSACMQVRDEKTLSKDFKLVDENGEELEDETKKLSGQWFKEAMSIFLQSKYYGFTLLQFGDRYEHDFKHVSVVPREYVYPQKGIIRNSPTSASGVSYETGALRAWTLGAGKIELGLLSKVAPLSIYKKSSLASWADFTDLFGSPLRVGKTDMTDEDLVNNMFQMLAEMGSSAYGVFGLDDEIEFVQATKTDAYEVFDKGIERHNSEISKLILGSTMTTDDGSSRSQSEVHERTSDVIIKSDSMALEYWVNTFLIPFLNRYHDFNLDGKFMFDDTEVTTLQEQFERDIELIKTGKYDVPADYITEKYGTPVEAVETQEPKTIPPGGSDPDGSQDPDNLDNNLPDGGPGVGKSKQPPKNCVDYLAIVSEFYSLCCENELQSLPSGPILSEDEENKLYRDIWNGKTTPLNLPVNLYDSTGRELTKGIDEGIGAYNDLALGYVPDQNFFDALKDNAFKFSAAKTFQQVRQMSDLLTDDEGKPVSFAKFKKDAKIVFDEFNKNYLRAEYNQAFNGAQMASRWQDIEQDADLFPFLQYQTAGDGRVRPQHAELDNVIRPVNDEFWETFYPPNGWNCRCNVIQLSEGESTDLRTVQKPKLDPEFDLNTGKQKILYSPEHPYFIVEKQFEPLKADNFGLPQAPEIDSKAVKEATPS